MNRIISSALSVSTLILGIILPREEAGAQTTYELKGLREEAQAYGILSDNDKALMQTANEVKGIWEEWLREEALMQAANEQTVTVNPQVIEQLELISRKFEEAINSNDAVAVAELFAEDGVFVTDGGRFYGPEAIEKLFVDLFKGWRFSNHLIKTTPNSLRIIGTAENIASDGEWSQTLQGQNGGPGPIEHKGYWGAIDTRQGNDWKILMLTVNVTPAPAATTASAETK